MSPVPQMSPPLFYHHLFISPLLHSFFTPKKVINTSSVIQEWLDKQKLGIMANITRAVFSGIKLKKENEEEDEC